MSETKRPDRRDFLKATSAAVAGASVLGGLSITRSAHAAGSDVIKVALIGAGGRGTGAADQLMNADKNLKLIAVADAFEKRAKSAIAKLTKKHKGQVDVPADRLFLGPEAYKSAPATAAARGIGDGDIIKVKAGIGEIEIEIGRASCRERG